MIACIVRFVESLGVSVGMGVLVATMSVTPLIAQTREAEPPPDGKSKTAADDLSKRLIKGASAESDVMDRIIGRMGDAADLLGKRFDPGSGTQDLQRRIIADLDAAIAAAIRRAESGTGASVSVGDVRERAKPGQGDASASDSRATPTDAADAGGEPLKATAPTTGPFQQPLRGWGHLPERDRAEIIQGLGESHDERFRKWIERYYRALAEDGS